MNCASAQSQGKLPQGEPLQSQWGFSDLHHLQRKHKSKQSGIVLGFLEMGLEPGTCHQILVHLLPAFPDNACNPPSPILEHLPPTSSHPLFTEFGQCKLIPTTGLWCVRTKVQAWKQRTQQKNSLLDLMLYGPDRFVLCF